MRHIASISLWLAGLALGGFGLNLLGVVGVHYLHPVENDPFPVSADVIEISGDRIELADGRAVKIGYGIDQSLRELIRESGGRIGLEVDENGSVNIYVRQRQFICEMSMPMIIIPLVPVDVPYYRRKLVAIGKIASGQER